MALASTSNSRHGQESINLIAANKQFLPSIHRSLEMRPQRHAINIVLSFLHETAGARSAVAN